ncbi:OsmC family protein [Flaviflexus huanghaiensis]|uniref:OsmC family protein n=1 Tax=Flaviflexus huanghaiensis TaxID=1111473 RepID=UPI0015F7D165|nr:OsmC family protein [Flaviflexus huanghaiensis]
MKAVRTGVREWIATNDRGAVVKIGDPKAQDVFSPGELLQLAAATCAGLSIDHRLTHALGEDIHVSLEVQPESVKGENRYGAIDTVFSLDLSSLSGEELERLLEKVYEAIERSCTVKRTLDATAESRHQFIDEPLGGLTAE